MIEVTFRIESLDYTDKLDSQLPLVLEALSQSGNINPVLKLACNTPEASSRIVKGILRTMSQDQKQRLATKIVNANREKLMQKLFKTTTLQDSFGCNFNILVGGMPPARASTCTSATAPPRSVKAKTESRRPITGGVFICRSFILPSRACTSLPLFVCA